MLAGFGQSLGDARLAVDRLASRHDRFCRLGHEIALNGDVALLGHPWAYQDGRSGPSEQHRSIKSGSYLWKADPVCLDQS